ncbi:nucleoside diphosphate kinase regulator [Pseudomonas sp.]|uniref:nucleoside diphosphate kinase regulator n=1 Tax=Pseudomonas sp. TaxID=306 RepID=UPI0027296C03|nr:nucleoside diphosphate kinase regulator [Pseudomonas sp.]
MSKLPPIVMTRLDVQRLDRVLYALEAPLIVLESLESEIVRAKVVDPARVAPDVVTMNSVVRFRDEVTQREFILKLVYPDAAGHTGTISVLAPVGTALLGMKVGRSIDWKTTSDKPIRLTVLEILYQPEANGDFHL